jgi:N,N'-diacetyllegionaminate synthase
MILFGRQLGIEVAIIAEIGVNHEGDVEAASRLIKAAASAGADAVKLQSYTPDRLASAVDPVRLQRVTRFALSMQAHERLFAEAVSHGVRLFSTAVTEDWVPWLAANSPAVKIASGDLTFEPVIRAAASSGRVVILSTGCGDVAEVDRAVDWVAREVGSDALRDHLVLMHCVSAYPAPAGQANLLSVPFMRDRYGVEVGYSNHVIGPDIPLAAVALGASVIELHFTDCREGRDFRDHQLSVLPQELADFVVRARAVCAARGSLSKSAQECELASRDAIRKGVVAARDLAAGTVLARADLMYARPATEVSSGQLEKVIGRALAVDLKRGMPIPRSVLGV